MSASKNQWKCELKFPPSVQFSCLTKSIYTPIDLFNIHSFITKMLHQFKRESAPWHFNRRRGGNTTGSSKALMLQVATQREAWKSVTRTWVFLAGAAVEDLASGGMPGPFSPSIPKAVKIQLLWEAFQDNSFYMDVIFWSCCFIAVTGCMCVFFFCDCFFLWWCIDGWRVVGGSLCFIYMLLNHPE